MASPRSRKELSANGLHRNVRHVFEAIPDHKPHRTISQADVLMSGLAVFGFKYPSLLQFDQDRQDQAARSNLKSLYGVQNPPSDTHLRQCLDELNPEYLRQVYTRLFATCQRGKGLEGFEVLGNYYLVSIDGTGIFSSRNVHCPQCCEKQHRDGQKTYYHQMLGAVMVHPNCREVIPLMPEPILKHDGAKKNDGERNAAKRLLRNRCRDHPHLKLLIVEDGLASNGPHIQHLQDLKMSYILGAKASDHPFLFNWVETTETSRTVEIDETETGITHRFRYHNGVPLNATHFDLEVNFLEYWEHSNKGKVRHVSWVTDIPMDESNVMDVMRAARARWKIENETFNTLKNQGYGLEHNDGHGHQHLSTVLAHLMMIAFLMDQIQLRCCAVFNQALERAGSYRRLWRKMRALFDYYFINTWEDLYQSLIQGQQVATLTPRPP